MTTDTELIKKETQDELEKLATRLRILGVKTPYRLIVDLAMDNYAEDQFSEGHGCGSNAASH